MGDIPDVRDGKAVAARRLRWSVTVANAAAAVIVAVYVMLLPPGGQPHGSVAVDNVVSAALLLVYLAVSLPAGCALGDRWVRRGCAFVDEQRAPTDEERCLLLRAPGAVALISFAFWLGAAAVFGGLNRMFDPSGFQAARV